MLVIAGMNFGTTVSQVQVPAVYRYHIELRREWRAYMSGDKFLVIAPPVKPTLPVAPDMTSLKLLTKTGWGRFNGQENVAALLTEITKELEVKAKSPSYVEFQREAARKTVTEFAAKWLVKQEQWKSVKPEQIKVYFADEPIERMRSFGREFSGAM